MRSMLAAAVLCGVLAGCGGGDEKAATPAAPADDRAAVEASFRTYLDELAARDGKGACAQMATSLQDEMLAAMRDAGAGALVEGKSCGQVLDFIAEQNQSFQQVAELLTAATISDVRVDGDKATYSWSIAVGGKPQESRGEQQRVGDRWLITCCMPGQ
jgi:hypothetical protein